MTSSKPSEPGGPHDAVASPSDREPAIAAVVRAVEAFARRMRLKRFQVRHRRNARGEWVIVLVVER